MGGEAFDGPRLRRAPLALDDRAAAPRGRIRGRDRRGDEGGQRTRTPEGDPPGKGPSGPLGIGPAPFVGRTEAGDAARRLHRATTMSPTSLRGRRTRAVGDRAGVPDRG